MSSWRPALRQIPKLRILSETNEMNETKETAAWAKGMPR